MPALSSKPELIRGSFLVPTSPNQAEWVRDGLLRIDAHGKIRDWTPSAASVPGASAIPVTAPNCVWTPGFVDTHVHFPQTRVIARSSGALLPWLDQTVFPEESRFSDASYARMVAEEFCRQLVQSGTTCASIYGSSQIEATEILFDTLDRFGLRAQAGPVLMDQGAPAAICVPRETAIPGCEKLIRKWHGHDGDRLRFAVTPRFALSCSRELLQAAGQLAAKYDLPIQTHLSENPDEIAAVAAMYPEHANYLDVYDAHGLCTDRSVFGHCIHLTDSEWNKITGKRASISHCPDSNFFLGSGVFKLREAITRGARVGLGSDVGAGRTFNMRRVAGSAYDASLLAQERVSPNELFWLATAGGAESLNLGDRIGSIRDGFDADLVAVNLGDDFEGRFPTTLESLLDRLLFQAGKHQVQATLVRGRRLSTHP